MAVKIRGAADEETNEVVALILRAWQARVDSRSSGHRFDTTALRKLVHDEDARVLVAEDDGQLLGTLIVIPGAGSSTTAEITKVSVDPKAFGSGIGEALLTSAHALAAEIGCTETLLAVSAYQPDLVRWYARMGYAVTFDRIYGHASPHSPAPIVMIRPCNGDASPGPVETAVRVLQAGGLVAMPTETVYGLAADATDPIAVRSVFATKGRPVDHPLIVHLASPASLPVWAVADHDARRLAEAFWPGPLTMVLPRQAHVLDEVTGGRDTVALRVPRHPVALALLALMGRHAGLVAPSANPFGAVSPTTADHVRADGLVDTVLDGGPCTIGLESTIVELVEGRAQILRAGAITAEQLSAVLGRPVDPIPTGPARAPGMLASHYAPRAAVTIHHSGGSIPAGSWSRVGYLGPGPVPHGTIELDAPTPYSSETLAPLLYARLREADNLEFDLLLIEAPADDADLSPAVVDRLTRASATRPTSL
jgi:L-threonylcarbamoyladenylate synthase